MNLPQMFNYRGAQVRTVIKNEQPWFVLKDACDILGLRAPDVRQRLSDDVVSTHTVKDSLGRDNTAIIINEDGLYDVILESRKAEARAFRKWVTSEVLPSIRKHGAYMTPQTLEAALSNPDAIITILNRLKQEQEEKAAIAAAKAQLEQKIEHDRPMMLFAESVQISQDSILVADMARLLKQNGVDIGEKRMFIWLRENGYLIKSGSEYNMPTQRSMDMKLFEIRVSTRQGSDGTPRIQRTPKITGRGQIYFLNKFKGTPQAG